MNRAQRRKQARSLRVVAPDGRIVKPARAPAAVPAPPSPPAVPDAEREARTKALWASIPERLRSTPEAALAVSRVQATWTHPVPAAKAAAWQAEWQAFCESQPEAVMERAARSGLWVPGQS